MSNTHNARTPQEIAQAGLRILARIIAREAVKDRLAKMEAVKPVPLFVDDPPAQVGECLKGAAQHERY